MLTLVILVLLMTEISIDANSSIEDDPVRKMERPLPPRCVKKKIKQKICTPSPQGPPLCVTIVRYYLQCHSKA